MVIPHGFCGFAGSVLISRPRPRAVPVSPRLLENNMIGGFLFHTLSAVS